MARPRLLGLSGSLRRESSNTMILKTLAEMIEKTAELTLLSLAEVPFYNADLDTSHPPASVSILRHCITEADGLVIASPEFNHGMPGVLKNALDWASRPYGRSCLVGKPVLTVTSSPGALGGVRAQQQLNETFLSTHSRVLARPQAVITYVTEKIADGRLVDPLALRFLLEAMADLIALVPGGEPQEPLEAVI